MSSILNSFLPKKWTSFLSDSQEEDPANTRREDAQPPNSSSTTLQDKPSQPAPPHSLNTRTSVTSQTDASRQNQAAKRKASSTRRTSEELRLLGDYETPRDATFIQPPRSSPQRNMPPHKFGNAGPSLAGRNTLQEKRKTKTYHSNTKSPLLLGTTRGDNVQPLHHEFPEPIPAKRRKTNHATNMEPNVASIIDLEGDDIPPHISIISGTSKLSDQGNLRIPQPILSGVEESRNIDRIVSSPRGIQAMRSQRLEAKASHGQTREQPVLVDDDSQKITNQVSNAKADPTTTLFDSLTDELQEVKSERRKKRPGPHSATITSRFFENKKRSKTKAIADFIANGSDEDLDEVARPSTNSAATKGRGSKESESLAKTFRRDNRTARTRPAAHNGIDDSDDMSDELGLTSKGTQNQRNIPNGTETNHQREISYEIPESPQPEDKYISPANIPTTPFRHSEKASVKVEKGTAKKASKAHRESIYPLITYRDSLNRIPSSQPGIQLRLADDKNGFCLTFCDDIPIATIENAKVKSLQWSPDGCRFVRIQGVRESTSNLIWDLKFVRVEDVKKFVLQLKDMAKINLFTRSPAEMRKMFDNFPTQRVRTEQADVVVDRDTELDLLERRVNIFNSAEQSVSTRRASTPSRQVKGGTLMSQLLASAQHETKRITRGHEIGATKFDDDVKLPSLATERPKRTTRATKPIIASPTPEPERYSVKHGLGKKWDQPVVYPERDPKTDRSKKQVSIQFEDLERLDEGEWLNDTLIEFCLLYIQENHKQHASKVYFFSNFFYTKLTTSAKGKSINYDAVKRWTAKDDIFTYDFVVVPVCEKGHWYLALICNLPELQRKLASEEEVTEEVQGGPLPEINEKFEEARKTGAPEDAAEQHQMRKDYSSLSLDSPPGKPNHTVLEDEDTVDLVRVQDEDRDPEQVPKLNGDTFPAEPISNGQAKATTSSAKKKGKRVSMPRKYPANTPMIAILDSMPSSTKHYSTISALKSYLVEEALSKRGMEISKDDFLGMQPVTGFPLQDNFSDCGVYLCRYVEVLMKDPKAFGEKLLAAEFDMERDWAHWESSASRVEIRNQLQDLARGQSEKRKAKAERKANNRAAAQSKMENTIGPSATEDPAPPKDAPISTTLQPSSPIIAPSAARGTSPTEDAGRVKITHRSAKPLPSLARAPGSMERATSVMMSPARSERGNSLGPRWSARSTPAEYDAHPGDRSPIVVHDETIQNLAPERAHRDIKGDQSDDDMLFDNESSVLVAQLMAAAGGTVQRQEKGIEHDNDSESEEEFTGFSTTPKGSPAPEVHPSTTADPAPQRTPKMPVYLEKYGFSPLHAHH